MTRFGRPRSEAPGSKAAAHRVLRARRCPAQRGIYVEGRSRAFDPVLRAWLHDQADVVIERIKPAIREWMDEISRAMLEEVRVRNRSRTWRRKGQRTGRR